MNELEKRRERKKDPAEKGAGKKGVKEQGAEKGAGVKGWRDEARRWVGERNINTPSPGPDPLFASNEPVKVPEFSTIP